MKRISSACLMQTSRFETEEEYIAYIASLKKKGKKFREESCEKQTDGTVVLKICLQYLNYSTNGYLD